MSSPALWPRVSTYTSDADISVRGNTARGVSQSFFGGIRGIALSTLAMRVHKHAAIPHEPFESFSC